MKVRIVLVIGFLLLALVALATGQTRRSKRPDADSLRASFIAAFGKDFELVKDELKRRPDESGRDTFWLAYVKPQGLGYFALEHSFKPENQAYSHVEHIFGFTVAPQGCRRGVPSFGVYSRFCMGDTIIVPILVTGAASHKFELITVPPAPDEDWRTFAEKHPDSRDRGLDKTPAENPSENLLYVGRRADKRYRRSLGYMLHMQAEFEATKPGRFNLLVTSSPQSVRPGETPPGSRPIIVVDRNTPLTFIAGRWETKGFTRGDDGREYESSVSQNSYATNLLVLQPGDRISFTYLSVDRDADFERRENSGRKVADEAEATKPVISVHPFALETRYDYSGWLVDYLP